jgi:Family of unknown function (DUF6502)
MSSLVKRSNSKSNLVGPEVQTVLRRISAFFMASGLTDSELDQQFRIASSWAKRRRTKPKLFRAGATAQYNKLVESWLRDPTYLNDAGNPIALPVEGKISIASIKRSLHIKGSTEHMVATLVKMGCLKKVRGGRFSLVLRAFYARRSGHVAYEPYAQFLVSAVTAATLPLNIDVSDRSVFWLNSTTEDVPIRQVKPFMKFVWRKGMAQLREIDDWHALRRPQPHQSAKNANVKRLGVGLFTFVQDPET